MTEWTDDMVEALRVMWDDGLSGSQVRSELNTRFRVSLSRSAVVAKVTRLGLTHKRERPRATTLPPLPGSPPMRRQSGEVAPAYDRFTVLDLGRETCRAPGAGDGLFCGRRVAAGLSYCPDHARRMYNVRPK